MSFSKAKTKRFNDHVIGCGPPPTAYDPRFPGGGHAVSFTKGERFRHQNLGHDLPDSSHFQLTRSHSSSSVGSSESGTSTKPSQSGKKDHAQCNKQIADMEKELRNVTRERNDLLKQRNQGSIGRSENKENEPVTGNSEIEKLNLIIEELQIKLKNAKSIEEEKIKLEKERDSALADLQSKKEEISSISSQIEETKAAFAKQESQLRSDLEQALEAASRQKTELEGRLAQLETDLVKKETEQSTATKELTEELETREKRFAELREKHQAELERIQADHVGKYQELENNLQQLAAEHDAESEQIKFEFGRQIEELNASHAAAIEKLTAQHAVEMEQERSSYKEQIEQLNQVRDQLLKEKDELTSKNCEIMNSFEDKVTEISTIKAQFDAEKEVLKAEKAQVEEKFEAEKVTLQQQMVELKASLVEQQAAQESTMMSQFTEEKSALNESINELAAQLHTKQAELHSVEQKLVQSTQQFEEQLKRLSENTQTEKEILIWQMNQEKASREQALKAEYDRCLTEKDGQYENMRADLETKLNQAKEEHENQVEGLISEHEAQINENRRLHDEAVQNLERQKGALIEERDSVLRQLVEKEADIEELTNQMNKTTAQLQLDLELLRESNDALVADVMRVTQEKMISEERLETENIEIQVRSDEEKRDIISSYEESLSALKAVLDDKDKQVMELGEKMCGIEISARQFMDEKLGELEDLRLAHVSEMERMSAAHKEEVLSLHKRYEAVIVSMEEKFVDDTEKLTVAHIEVLEALKNKGQEELKALQDEFRVTFMALEHRFTEERDAMSKTREQELFDLNEIHEERLKLVRQEHDIIVAELRRNCEEAMENVKELQNEVEDVRNEYQCISAASKEKEIQHLNDIESWNDSLNSKEEELIKLREQIQQRERQTADEWIQRETVLMEQFSARFRDSKEDYETRLQTAEEEKSKLADKLRQLQTERDEAVGEVEVFQIKMDTQLAAMEEQHEEERSMLQARWNQQMDEISSQQQRQVSQVQRKVDEANSELEALRKENTNLRKQSTEVEEVFIQRMERLQLEHKEKLQTTVQQAMEPVEEELEAFRQEHDEYLKLKKKYQELLDMIEPFREQLEMFEAEKNALYNEKLSAENTMASLASKYAQLLGHQNNKQKIHHLDKLKQDIFNLRKDMNETRLALEKEKKARQKAEAKLKEMSGQRKYDPSEAFKVPETPVVTPAPVAAPVSRKSVAPPVKVTPKAELKERVPLRSQAKGAFFVSMAEIEATQAEAEQEKLRQIQSRREKSEQFDAFVVDFGTNRRETFDVPPKLNVTRNMGEDKENVRGNFVHDLSGISIADEVQKSSKSNHLRPDVMTSTPLSVQRHGSK